MAPFRYDPKSRRMVEEAEEGSRSGYQKGDVTYIVRGEELRTLLAFAEQDELDLSNSNRRGRAISAYVRVALQEWIEAREQAKEGR